LLNTFIWLHFALLKLMHLLLIRYGSLTLVAVVVLLIEHYLLIEKTAELFALILGNIYIYVDVAMVNEDRRLLMGIGEALALGYA
jgi:hypothetical protein